MSAAGAGAGIPQQPGQFFGGRRPGYWIRHMNGRSTTLQAPDGSTVEVPTAHMPHGSAPGQPLDEQAFTAGHQERQFAAQARSPFVQQLAQQAPGQEAGTFTPQQPATPGMMIQPGSGPVTQHAQRLPASQAASAPAVAAPGSVGSAPLPPSAASPPTPAPASANPPPAPTGVTWGSPQMMDYLRQYGPGTTGLSQEQVDTLLGRPSAGPSAGTAAYNAAQQQFTGNNAGYGTTGYQGNDAQVATQVAHGAQASSIPTGVLDSSFWQGGSNFGGGQTTENTASGNNGATNWNDPSVSGFGVDATLPQGLVTGIAGLRGVLANTPVTTGQVGQALTSIPRALAAYQTQQSQPIQQQASQIQPAVGPAVGPSFSNQLAAAAPGAGPSSSGSVDYTPRQPAVVQPVQGAVSGGGYTPPATGTQTQLTDAQQTRQTQQQPQNTQPATQKLSGTPMPAPPTPAPTPANPYQAPTDSAFQRALANAQVAPSTGPATESLKGRAHF